MAYLRLLPFSPPISAFPLDFSPNLDYNHFSPFPD